MEEVTLLAEEAVEVAKSGKKGLIIGGVVLAATALGLVGYYVVKKIKSHSASIEFSTSDVDDTTEE